MERKEGQGGILTGRQVRLLIKNLFRVVGVKEKNYLCEKIIDAYAYTAYSLWNKVLFLFRRT